MSAALFTATHIEVASAALTVVSILAASTWRAYKAAHRAAFHLAEWIDDRMAITAAQIADPIVEAQGVAHRMMVAHFEDCRQDRANTRVRLHSVERKQSNLERSVMDLADRGTTK